MKHKPNIETRISNRLRSIFAAFGQVINDFYLEAGIYFVGGFNAVLVAWDIYTSMTANGQPLPYAVVIAIIAFIAVEGLAVYLVGAAAKTNNGLLWFFSVVFAGFFTYAHYQEMTANAGIIAEYITLAIPFFVVVGYWARTVKIDVEAKQIDVANQIQIDKDRQQAIEDEERQRVAEAEERQRQIEDEDRQRNWAIEDEVRQQQQAAEDEDRRSKAENDRLKTEGQNEVKRLKAEAQKSGQSGQKSGHLNQMDRQNGSFEPANDVRVTRKIDRQNDLLELVKTSPSLGPTELTKQLNDLGHSASVSTVKRDIKSLNGSLIKS